MQKTAMDKATEEYWSNYFRDYGKMWVRNIPRRIKAAMVRSKDIGVKIAEGHIVPIAYNASDNSLSIEAAFNGKLDDKESQVFIVAEFNDQGRMQKFEASRIA